MRRTTRITKPTFKVRSKASKDNIDRSKKSNNARADDGWADCDDELKSTTTKQVEDPKDIELLLSRINMNPTPAPAYSPISAVKHPVEKSDCNYGYNPPPKQDFQIDPMIYLCGSSGRSVALDICDFVNLTPPVSHLDISDCAGADDVLKEFYRAKSGPKRPKLQDVTVAQWGLANTRIMNKLFLDTVAAAVIDIQGMRRYLAYTAKTFELFGKFDRVSVLEYDQHYRMYQAANNLAWGTDVPHLETMSLYRSSLQQKSSVPSQVRNGGSSSSGGQKSVCKMYNSMGGCKFGLRCNYAHQCLKCSESHPQFVHNTSGPVQYNKSNGPPQATGQPQF